MIEITGTNGKGETVTVKIEGDKTEITTKGFKGRSCQSATAMLELALGVKTSDTPTQEMFTQPAGGQTVKTS